nr:hypothetical protein SUGSMm_29750 [Morganella morganii subsp. sibonii]
MSLILLITTLSELILASPCGNYHDKYAIYLIIQRVTGTPEKKTYTLDNENFTPFFN